MKQEIFLDGLKRDGFPEPLLIVREGAGFLEQHAHPYAARALITEGQIDITIGGIKSTYLAGDIFELSADQVHSETYGGKGVQYLVGRKGVVLQEELAVQSSGAEQT